MRVSDSPGAGRSCAEDATAPIQALAAVILWDSLKASPLVNRPGSRSRALAGEKSL